MKLPTSVEERMHLMTTPFHILTMAISLAAEAIPLTTNSKSPLSNFMSGFIHDNDGCMVAIDLGSRLSLDLISWLPTSVPKSIISPDAKNLMPVKKTTTCLVTFLDDSAEHNLSEVIQATNSMEKHLLVAVRESKPKQAELHLLRRPILWINYTTVSGNYLLYSHTIYLQ